MNSLWFANFLFYWLLPLTAYRILMVWVYENTGSVLTMQIMHAFYTGSLFMFSPTGLSLTQNLLWEGLFMLGLWGLVGGVALAARRKPLHEPAPATGQ
jgi:hypothetical protein